MNEMNDAIKYFTNIMNDNISHCSSHKMGATFIGIKTNISGVFKLHIYILLFPFPKNENVVAYSKTFQNLYFKDVCFNVDESFYLWLYEEMKTQKSIVILSLESNMFKVVSNDLLITIDKNCNEKKEWMDVEYEVWCKKETFDNVFTIKITNPYLYVVPFPVKPIIIKTIENMYKYVKISC